MDLGVFIMSLVQAAKERLNLVDEENTIKPITVNLTNLTIYLSKSPLPLPPELPSDQPEMQDPLHQEEMEDESKSFQYSNKQCGCQSIIKDFYTTITSNKLLNLASCDKLLKWWPNRGK